MPAGRTFALIWLATAVPLFICLAAIPLLIAWRVSADSEIENDAVVQQAHEEFIHQRNVETHRKYFAERVLAENRISPPLSVRALILAATLITASLLVVPELVAYGLMVGWQGILANFRWYAGSSLAIYAALLGVPCAVGVTQLFKFPELGMGMFFGSLFVAARAIIGTSISLPILHYKLWCQVQDGEARATPARAIGFLFIPFYNFYWIFVAFPGLADELNRCAARRSLEVKPASRKLMFTYCILCFVALIPFLGILAGLVNITIGILAFRSAARVASALK